jgi:hypothetical protein
VKVRTGGSTELQIHDGTLDKLLALAEAGKK